MRLVNVALGRPATQSSFSPWSTELGAGGLVNGDFEQNFGFCSDIEDAPWWRVDLISRMPLEAIIVHNRLDVCQERARTLKIDVSDDDTTWTTVHAGLWYFGGGRIGTPLTIQLGSQVWARYVRLSLTERTYFHLSQLEVLADAHKANLAATREDYRHLKLFAEERETLKEATSQSEIFSSNESLYWTLIHEQQGSIELFYPTFCYMTGGPLPAAITTDHNVSHGPVDLCSIKDAYFYPAHGVVISKDGMVFKHAMQQAAYFSPNLSDLPFICSDRGEVYFSAPADIPTIERALVTFPMGGANYCHFMLNCLSGVAAT